MCGHDTVLYLPKLLSVHVCVRVARGAHSLIFFNPRFPFLSSLLQPGLRFSGPTLAAACSALSAPAVGCCFRTWAQLMAAAARQLCFEDLAEEYAALPGRCELLTQATGVNCPLRCGKLKGDLPSCLTLSSLMHLLGCPSDRNKVFCCSHVCVCLAVPDGCAPGWDERLQPLTAASAPGGKCSAADAQRSLTLLNGSACPSPAQDQSKVGVQHCTYL